MAKAADKNDLVVTSDLVLAAVYVPNTYHTITIEAGATLTVSLGVTLTFTAGGGIEGAGKLIVNGSSTAPVIFQGASWGSLIMTGDVSLNWLRISGASGPFVFQQGVVKLDHVIVQDVPDSRFLLIPQANSAVTFHAVAIEWGLLKQGTVDVLIQGPVGEVDFSEFSVPRKLQLGSLAVAHISGGYIGLYVTGGGTSDGCYFTTASVFHQSAEVSVFTGCKPEESSLLFVPGYGASFNLSYLLDPAPVLPLKDGFRFTPFLTSSYDDFLHAAQARGIKTLTAYYDWRRSLAGIMRDYFIPALDALKARDHVKKVYIVAHSFGGIVARYYIQSDQYRGDVAGLVMIGTPNSGLEKAYEPWEGDSLPSDWQVVNNLVRYYHYKFNTVVPSDLIALRTFIPSLKDLLPIDPVLARFGKYPLLSLTREVNTELIDLLVSKDKLLQRVPLLFTVAGTGEYTASEAVVGDANPHSVYWPDGEPYGVRNRSQVVGDGTVTVTSVQLPSVSQLIVQGAHANLPGVASEEILSRLYPNRTAPPPRPAESASRDTAHILWFAFDCPVAVAITLPSGLVINSSQQSSDTVAILSDPEMLWMLVPEEVGTYKIAITALADTQVRWWQGIDTIHTYTLKQGQTRSASYVVAPAIPILSPTPTPSPIAGATPYPSPTVTPLPVTVVGQSGPDDSPPPAALGFTSWNLSAIGTVLLPELPVWLLPVPHFKRILYPIPADQHLPGPYRLSPIWAVQLLFLALRKKGLLQRRPRHPT